MLIINLEKRQLKQVFSCLIVPAIHFGSKLGSILY